MAEHPDHTLQRSISSPENSPEPLAAAPATQVALAFGDDGELAGLTVEAPDKPRWKRRDADRFDTKRTAEYIARSGRMPAESYHSIARLTAEQAVRHLRKIVPGADAMWCFRQWVDMNDRLAALVHYRLGELDADGNAPVGGLAVSHYLAASAYGARLAEQAASGGGARGTHNTRLLTPRENEAQSSFHTTVTGDVTDAAPDAPLVLPPKGRD